MMVQRIVKIKRRYLLGKVNLSPFLFTTGLIYSSPFNCISYRFIVIILDDLGKSCCHAGQRILSHIHMQSGTGCQSLCQMTYLGCSSRSDKYRDGKYPLPVQGVFSPVSPLHLSINGDLKCSSRDSSTILVGISRSTGRPVTMSLPYTTAPFPFLLPVPSGQSSHSQPVLPPMIRENSLLTAARMASSNFMPPTLIRRLSTIPPSDRMEISVVS